MVVLTLADLHLSANPRDRYRFAAMGTVVELIERYKPQTLLILGDLTEEKDFHSSVLVNDVVELLYIFSELCDVDVLLGNHDYTDATCPFFSFVRHIPNIRWIGEVGVQNIKGIGQCLMLPHTLNYKRDWKALANLPMDVEFIFAHNTFDGANVGHGKRMEGIPLDVLPDIDIIAGDVHVPQELGRLTYVGAPYTIDFGDDYESRALLIDKEIKSISIPGPQKRLLELTSADAHLDVESGDIVKVRYQLTAKERDRWPEIRDKIKSRLVDAGCMVYAVQPIIETAVGKTSVSFKKADIKTDTQLITDYARQLKFDDATLAIGLGLL